MARILMLAARTPFPPDDGWKIRTASLLRGLAEAGHEMHLLSFASNADVETSVLEGPLARFETVQRRKAYAASDLMRGFLSGTPFSVLNYQRRDFARQLHQMVSSWPYDGLLVEDIVMAQYAFQGAVPVRVLDMHNVESDLLRRYAVRTRNPLEKLYARVTATKLARYEVAGANRFQAVLTCSGEDRQRILGMGVTAPVHVVPNGVRSAFYDSVAAAPSAEEAITFVGSMDYHANISGILHFVHETLPRILSDRPTLRFYVVGKNPPPEILALASQNVLVTGAVDDVRPFLARAQVVVVPLLVGGGTRLKILEAMASGRPVVSTRLGAEGISADDRHLVRVDEPAQFADAVLSLLKDPQRRMAIAAAARSLVTSTYDWSVVVAGLDAILDHLLAARPA